MKTEQNTNEQPLHYADHAGYLRRPAVMRHAGVEIDTNEFQSTAGHGSHPGLVS